MQTRLPNMEFLFLIISSNWKLKPKSYWFIRAGDTGGPGEPCLRLPTFLRSKKKKGKQREKRNTFKAETIKRLSPRSKCYCFSHSRASRIQKVFFSANHAGWQYLPEFHGPSTLKSILPALFIPLYFSVWIFYQN